jgi:hypothetical protein
MLRLLLLTGDFLTISEMPNIFSGLPQAGWDLLSLAENDSFRQADYPLPQKVKNSRYPLRIFRYWLGYHLLKMEKRMRERPLKVCEIGVDEGQMLRFVRGALEAEESEQSPSGPESRGLYSSWTGVDIRMSKDELSAHGYTGLIECDVEYSAGSFAADYDVVILLHLLEHLYEPEAFFNLLTDRLRPGTLVIVGLPANLHLLIPLRQQILRKGLRTANDHVSAFSVRRARKMVDSADLRLDFLSGAYFIRWDGGFLENYGWWFRCNVIFGGCFSRFPSEIYMAIRKV